MIADVSRTFSFSGSQHLCLPVTYPLISWATNYRAYTLDIFVRLASAVQQKPAHKTQKMNPAGLRPGMLDASRTNPANTQPPQPVSQQN